MDGGDALRYPLLHGCFLMMMTPPTNLESRLPAALPERPGIGEGARSFFGGFGFVLSKPDVWPLAIVPIAIALALSATLGWSIVAFLPSRIEVLLGPSSSAAFGVLAFLVKVVATLMAILVAALISFGLAQPLSGPALERIVRRVEADLGAPTWPKTSILEDVSRSLQSVLVGYAFGLPTLAVLFVLGLIFPPLTVVTIPLKIVVTAILITWDVCDYPLSIRGIPISERVSFLARNIRPVIGFGLGLALISLIPCALLLVVPSGVAGAARLVFAIERWEAATGRAPSGGPQLR
jgi:CysZ protein